MIRSSKTAKSKIYYVNEQKKDERLGKGPGGGAKGKGIIMQWNGKRTEGQRKAPTERTKFPPKSLQSANWARNNLPFTHSLANLCRRRFLLQKLNTKGSSKGIR